MGGLVDDSNNKGLKLEVTLPVDKYQDAQNIYFLCSCKYVSKAIISAFVNTPQIDISIPYFAKLPLGKYFKQILLHL